MPRGRFDEMAAVARQFMAQMQPRDRDEVDRQAEALPLRRDMVTLLAYVRDNRVIGTQSTGNLPLKAVREVTARCQERAEMSTNHRFEMSTFHRSKCPLASFLKA